MNSSRFSILFVKFFIFILGGAILLVVAIGGYGVLWPKFSEVRQEGVFTYRSRVKQLESKQRELQNLKDLSARLTSVATQERQRLKRILPTQKDFPDLFVQMERLVQDSGLKITRMSVTEGGGESVSTEEQLSKAAAVRPSIKTLTIALNLEGDHTYAALKEFLVRLEENMRLLDLSSLNYSSQSQLQGSYSINLKTYFME